MRGAASAALLLRPAPYLSRVGPMSLTLASGATVTSGKGNAPHWLWSRSGYVTGLWLGIFGTGTREFLLANTVLQFYVDSVPHGTAGAEAQQYGAGNPAVVDVPTPMLFQMGQGNEFMPLDEYVDRQGREWVWQLTNNTGAPISTQLWVQFEADQ